MLDATATAATLPLTASGRTLRFELGGRAWGLPVSAVAGLAPSRPPLPVPGAPREVLGLVEWRGGLYTLLDLPRLLGLVDCASDRACLVLLAPPFQQTALRMPATIALASAEPGAGPDLGPDVRLIDPAALVRDVESRIRERTAASLGRAGAPLRA